MTTEDLTMLLILLIMALIALGNIWLKRRNSPYPGLPKYDDDVRE